MLTTNERMALFEGQPYRKRSWRTNCCDLLECKEWREGINEKIYRTNKESDGPDLDVDLHRDLLDSHWMLSDFTAYVLFTFLPLSFWRRAFTTIESLLRSSTRSIQSELSGRWPNGLGTTTSGCRVVSVIRTVIDSGVLSSQSRVRFEPLCFAAAD